VVKSAQAGIVLALAASTLVAAGCGDDGSDGNGRTAPDGVAVPDGFVVDVVVDDLEGPTQFVVLPDGDLVVAEINGGEREGTGRVLLVSGTDAADRTVLVDGLKAPTGVAVDGELLWIMEQRRLTVGPLADPTDRSVVADDLPFNGRSEGTLTALAAGGILYDTSGSRDAATPDELKPGSGTLWYQASPDAEPEPYATGFKHAYAHVVDGDGALWSTEMSDGRLDGEVPPDELVEVAPGDDFGYPRCVGDGVPVAELDATAETCSGTPRSHALFEPGDTPTSVAVAPWDIDLLVVALWNRGEVVTVPRSESGRPHRSEPLLTGLDNPQHLVAVGGRLLVSDFSGGRIVSIARR
jgi:glucose/arabinose dehydrogenase